MTSRREAMRLLLSAVGVSLLAACGSTAPAAVSSTPASAAQNAPAPAAAPPTTTPPAAATSPAGTSPAGTTPAGSSPVGTSGVGGSGQPAATQATASAPPKAGGTLKVGMIGDLGTIDGHQVTQATVNVTFLAYDRLIDYDDKLQPQPMLAESWDLNSDLTQFKLNLRKGVQYHSGREFTSDDVKYNLLRVRDPKVAPYVGSFATESAWFTDIELPDKYTVVLTADKPRPGAFDFFEYFNMLDHDTVEGPDAKTKAVGTGPFTFVEWVQGDHFTFNANKNYWQSGKPYLDGVSIKVFTDAQAQIAQLEASAIDLADSPPIRDAVRLQQDPTYTYLGTFIGGQYFCVFVNCTYPPLDNNVVRQALNYALDRERFAQTVMVNLVGPGQDLPWPPQAGAAEPAKNNVYTFDLDKAKSLLASAGVGAFNIDILYHNLAYPTEIASLAEILQADLAKIGITATLKLMDFPTFSDAVFNSPYQGLAIAGGAFTQLAESTTAFS
ncbi:MAG: ABC transporter substrate-binding protein, partial [Chloroflexi bacterium]|nr:ABC transporter substrate-binding protein [Chloroflexota bacterium]